MHSQNSNPIDSFSVFTNCILQSDIEFLGITSYPKANIPIVSPTVATTPVKNRNGNFKVKNALGTGKMRPLWKINILKKLRICRLVNSKLVFLQLR